ncbi:YciI family protein [Bauldia sp.]|uniref:YciI family protein n=1 Tax=Bauldia sp. TaxID=2575872 RepID=UPI003BACFB9A
MLYTILIYGVPGVFARLPDDEQEAHLAVHRAVQQDLSEKDVYRGAIRLMEPSTAMNVSGQGDIVTVLDGPFAETKEQVLGLYLVECDTMDEALAAAKALPQGVAHYEVRPVNWAGGLQQPVG